MRSETKSVIIVAAFTLLAVILKLCSVIGFSWWLVLLPLWLPLAVFSIIPATIGVVLGGFAFLIFWGAIGSFMNRLTTRKV